MSTSLCFLRVSRSFSDATFLANILATVYANHNTQLLNHHLMHWQPKLEGRLSIIHTWTGGVSGSGNPHNTMPYISNKGMRSGLLVIQYRFLHIIIVYSTMLCTLHPQEVVTLMPSSEQQHTITSPLESDTIQHHCEEASRHLELYTKSQEASRHSELYTESHHTQRPPRNPPCHVSTHWVAKHSYSICTHCHKYPRTWHQLPTERGFNFWFQGNGI